MKTTILIVLLAITGPLCFAQVPAYVALPGLLAWYPFNDNPNNAYTTFDNGVAYGDVSYGTDRFGSPLSCYVGDGSSGIDIPNSNFPSGNATRSVAAWYKSPLPEATGGNFEIFATGDNSAVGNRFGINTYPPNIGWESVGIGVDVTMPDDSAWHHLVITYPTAGTGSTAINVYLDGLLTSTYVIGGSTPVLNTDTGTIHYIGTLFMPVYDGIWDYSWVGSLDDMGVWDTALTPCQVWELYKASTGPWVGVINGPSTLCTGATITLSDTTQGGTWSSTATGIATISSAGVVTGVTAGTTIISYTDTNPCGTFYETSVVTVNTAPAAGTISGSLTVCTTATTTLSNPTGASGGVWSSSATGIATISSTGVVTGVATGTTTISYTVTNSCGSSTATAIVTVNTVPNAGTISGTLTLCYTSTTTLSDPTGPPGGTWSSAATGVATVSTSGVVTGHTAGTATISYTVSNTCGAASATAVVTVDANAVVAPISGSSIVCLYANITLNDVTTGGTWSSATTTIATVSTSGVVTGVATGTSTISYTVTNICGSVAASQVVTVDPAPTPIITPVGDTILCPAGFVALTANTAIGTNYQWYLGGSIITGALSSSYIATTPGSYQVLESFPGGCSTLSVPMSVTIDTPVAGITASGSTDICAGIPLTLNANISTGLSYQWLLSGVPISGAVGSSYTTTASGDYEVIVTNSTGCSATSNDITVTINPSPAANIVLSGPLTFCQGSNVLMTTTYSAGNAYQWYNAAGAIPGATGAAYTATATGAYYVTVINSYGCTATSIISSVVVNPLPDVTIAASGPTVFCIGGNVTLSATYVAGDTYQWYLGSAAIPGATNSSYLVTVGGGYRVQVTDPVTGCTATTLADTTVTVVNNPIIIPITTTSFCWGGSALLSTSVSGATGTILYQWYFNGAIIPGATSATYTAWTPGNYSCQITIPGSCTVTTINAPLTEFPLPDPVITFSEPYFHTATYYASYQWYMNLVPIPGATSSYTPSLGSGDYKVQVTDTNGCQSFSDVYVYIGAPTTGIQNINTKTISIFPNPATNQLTITAANTMATVTINNIIGQTIFTNSYNTTTAQIKIASFPAGVYEVMVTDNEGVKTVKKIVKE